MQRDPRIRPQFPAEDPLTDSTIPGGTTRHTTRTRRDDLDDWAALVPGPDFLGLKHTLSY